MTLNVRNKVLSSYKGIMPVLLKLLGKIMAEATTGNDLTGVNQTVINH